MKPTVFIISAPSGSGKSTLVNRVRTDIPKLSFSVSYTTRPPRGSERNGYEYYFVSRDEFERMIAKEEFLEHANVFGNYYGTAKRFLREAEREFAITSSPDLNAILKMPGALSGAAVPLDGNFEAAVLVAVEQAIASLDAMRIEEGKGIDKELRDRIARLKSATSEIEKLRPAISKAHMEKIHARLKELISTQVDSDRVLQEAAIMAERSDVQEEIVRMHTHIQHFLGLLDEKGEIGKKLDFLLQEMNREANTLLSKTAGVSGEGLRITEFGLAMKSEIEKLREQVQNVE